MINIILEKYNKLDEDIEKVWKNYKYIIQNDKNIKWIKKIKFMSGKGNRSQYHNCSQQPFPVPSQPGKNSASVGTGGKMIVHVRYSISAFISMISV